MAGHVATVLLCTFAVGVIRLIGEFLTLSSCGYTTTSLDQLNAPVPRSPLPINLAGADFMGIGNNMELLVPRIIHQTYKSHEVPRKLEAMVDTWNSTNPGWDVRLYNDTECLELVKLNFPQYLDAYLSLPKNVERADFFRYMVVLLHGGMYADMDTECKRPLDSVIRSRDRMVVGWELEFSSSEQAARRSYARTRQVLQWVFAAAPGHPVLREACDLIAANAKKQFSGQTDRDTLERTGPGMFTDVVLKHAFDPEKGIRILPRVAFGVNPLGDDGLNADSPGITVHHHYAGSWKEKILQAPQQKGAAKVVHKIGKKIRKIFPKQNTIVKLKDSNTTLFPVGIPWEPSFVVMVHLKGHGVHAAGSDVGADITNWGNWQAGMDPTRTPRVVDVLLELLDRDEDQGLIDVGAGLGFFTLAAASRGHSVVAFEPSIKNVEALREGVEFNGFRNLVQVVHGAPEGQPCEGGDGWNMRKYFMTSTKQRSKIVAASMHSQTIEARQIFDTRYLDGIKFGGLRIGVSAAAQTRAIITAALESQFRKKPKVVMIEFMPFVMCTHEDPSEVLMMLHRGGYTGVYHAGEICKNSGSHTPSQACPFRRKAVEFVGAQVWCKIEPEEFGWLVNSALPGWPENLIFVNEEQSTHYPGFHL